MNTHNVVVDFGKHKGELWTRLPVSYLKWCVNTMPGGERFDLAKSELERRGTTLDATIEISGHAIDRASLNCRAIWHQTKIGDEGLHRWLCRVGTMAIDHGERDGDKIRWGGMKFVFEFGNFYPTMKTVMPE